MNSLSLDELTLKSVWRQLRLPEQCYASEKASVAADSRWHW